MTSFSSLELQLDIEDVGIDSDLEEERELEEVLHSMDTTGSSSSPYEPSTLISPELEAKLHEEVNDLTKSNSPPKQFARHVLNSEEFVDQAIQELKALWIILSP